MNLWEHVPGTTPASGSSLCLFVPRHWSLCLKVLTRHLAHGSGGYLWPGVNDIHGQRPLGLDRLFLVCWERRPQGSGVRTLETPPNPSLLSHKEAMFSPPFAVSRVSDSAICCVDAGRPNVSGSPLLKTRCTQRLNSQKDRLNKQAV